MKYWIERINGWLSMLCAWGLLILTLILVYDFMSRGAPGFFAWLSTKPGMGWSAFMGQLPFLQPVHVITDISVIIMIMGVYLGLGYCEYLGEHVRLEILSNNLRGRGKALVDWTSLILQLATVAVMFYAMYRNTAKSIRTEEAAPGVVPFIIWPAKIVVCVGILFYLLQLFVVAADKWNARSRSATENNNLS